MDKRTNYQKLRELVKKVINENYYDDEDLGGFSGDFDPSEFEGPAMRAAKKDIGKEFEPLGKSRFEKNLNTGEFKKDLQRQNLNLPKDREETQKAHGMLDKRYVQKKHDKQFGVGSLNEDGEDVASKENIKRSLEMVEKMLTPGLPFIVRDISDKYATVNIDGDVYKIWGEQDDELWIADFQKGNSAGFMGTASEVANAINQKYSILTHMNENGFAQDGNPMGFETNEESDYEKMLAEKIFFDLNKPNGLFIIDSNVSNNDIMVYAMKNMQRDGLIDSDDDEGKYFYWLTDLGIKEITRPQDIEDYFYNPNQPTKNYEEPYLRGKEDVQEDVSTNLIRPKDSEGNPIILKARVEDATGSSGRVIRFGVDDKGKQTVHVEWIPSPIGQVQNPVTYPDKIVVRDSAIKIKEGEIDESSIRSHANGRGQNLKPGNFPETFKRDALKENLDQAISVDNDVFIVIDSAFNRAHYKDLIGQTFKDAPSYAQVKVVHPQDIEKEKSIKYDIEETKPKKNWDWKDMDEDYDYAAAEREHSAREELRDDSEQAQQYVPESLQQFLMPNSFKISQTDGDGRVEYSYMLKIPKQADELLKDIEKFIREEEPSTYVGPGQSYQKVSLYTELEKGTNSWVAKVNVVRGYDV